MDSTTPDPKPQQQQHQQQQQQPQQPQHQPQPMQQQQPPRPHQLHQPRPQQQPPPSHPHQHQMHPQAGPYLSHMPQPYPNYYRYPTQQFGYASQPYPQVSYNPHQAYNTPPQPWAQPANFPTVPAQPIPNMVPQQPQTNVPQTHTKPSSQIINPVNNSADQSHTLTLQSVTITNPTIASAPKSRQKLLATLKNPATKEVIPLESTSTPQAAAAVTTTTTNTTTTSTTTTTTDIKTSSTLATTTAPANAVSATQAAATTTASTSAPQTTNKGEEKKRLDNKKQEESSPAKIVQTKQQNPAQTLLQHVSEDGLETRNHPTISKNGQDSKKVEAGTTSINNDVASKDKSVSPKTSATKVGVSSIPDAEKVKEKVNGNDGDDKNDSCKIADKETDPKLESSKKVASEAKIDKPSVSTTNTTTTASNNGQDSKINKEAEIAKAAAAAPATKTQDGDESSANAAAGVRIAEDDGDQKDKECNVNGNDGDQQQQGDDSNQKVDQELDSKVELHYEPGQYNPISNRSGKKVYSKQFMLDVCEKICKLSLSPKESDDKIGLENDGLQNAFSEMVDMFMPNFAPNRFTPTNRQNEPARRQSQHLYAGRSSAGQEKQRKVITSVSLTQEVELKTVSNPWKRAKDIKEDATNDEVETELLKKKFRSILNKLTPNNFEKLAEAVTDLCIDSESKLGEVIDIVFAKALAEPGYCVLYGQMCSHLKKITAGTANFANTLLKRCQHQFQSDIYSGLNLNERKEQIDNEQDPEVKKQLNEALYEDMFRCRMRGLGLIKFIGELYKIDMLIDQIMFDCVVRLLSDTSEESLECLCDLLTTIGEKLDKSSMKNKEGKEKKVQQKSAPKANAYSGGQKSAAAIVASGTQKQAAAAAAAAAAAQEKQYMITTLDSVFEQIHKIRKNKDLPLSVRIRFKLLDTCELREKENWHSKRTKDNNPKKIEEIREAHKEKLEQERRQVNLMGPRRSQEGRRGLGHQGGSSSQISSMGNESGGSRGAGGQSSSNMHTSSSSHLLRDHSLGDMQMKTNHNDIESHKEHQKEIENLKTMSIFKDISSTTNRNSSSSSAEPLRPSSHLRPLRPMTGAAGSGSSGGLRPNSSSSAANPKSTSTTATLSSSAAASSKPATAATPPQAGVTEEDRKEDPQKQQES